VKIIGYVALHYGAAFLGYAIRSIIDSVDELWVLYTPAGSHGHSTNVPCPETKEELQQIAWDAAREKLHWVDGYWAWEGQQRDAIHKLCPDADLVLVLDSDEIWADGLAELAIEAALGFGCRTLRLPFIHYWRSFHRGFKHDPAYPVRVINPHVPSGEATLSAAKYINHFGYAQPTEIVRYKLQIHGHKNEFRRDVDWFNDVWLANRQVDCHPVGSQYWNAEPIDVWKYLPDFMRSHPFAELDIIP
jgi:hypothetical protein